MDTAPLANDANETQLPDEGESVDNPVYDPYATTRAATSEQDLLF
jgi:hypothetical protein